MTVREMIRQLKQVETEYETELDKPLAITFDSADNGYYSLIGVEIVCSLGTGKLTLIVTET